MKFSTCLLAIALALLAFCSQAAMAHDTWVQTNTTLIRTGDAVHWVRIEGVVTELYDVIALPNVRQPQALGFKSDEIRRVLRIAEEQPL